MAPQHGWPWSFANGEASLDDLTQPGWEKIYTRDVIPSEAGRTYRLRVDVRLNAPLTVSGGPPFAIRFYKLSDTYGDMGEVAWQGCYPAVDGNWYTCETTHTSDGSETYLRTSVYRRTAVTGAGSLDLRNLVIDDITDGEPTQHGTATNTYDGHLRRVKQTSPRGTFYSIYNLAGHAKVVYETAPHTYRIFCFTHWFCILCRANFGKLFRDIFDNRKLHKKRKLLGRELCH